MDAAAADGPGLWIDAEPGCPWSRAFLDAVFARPRRVPVVVVTTAPAAAWDDLRDAHGWDGLVVVSDPTGERARQRLPADAFLVTVAAWDAEGRVFAGVPASLDDDVAAAVFAFLTDPAARPDVEPTQTDVQLAAYTRHTGSRVTRKIARRRLMRVDDAASARLAADVADLLLEADTPEPADLRVAGRLVLAAAPHLGDDPVLASLRGPTAEGPGPAEVAGEALAGDVELLARVVREHYSGFPGLVERLELPWADHAAAAAAEARARPTWSWTEAGDLLVERLLAPVRDAHFAVHGESTDGARRRQWLADDAVAWFTDLVTDADRVVVAGPEGWVGRTLELPVVGAPGVGGPWLLPTLRADGAAGYLVGVVAVGDPPPVEVAGELLPVHRSRAAFAGDDPPPWAQPAPDVLEVRTMAEEDLGGVPETASTLRALPRVILDLRGNEGGSDLPAVRWVRGFSGGTFSEPTIADLVPGDAWVSFANPPWTSTDAPPYAGRLEILVDHAVCSSGESFAFLAAQIPGARLVGENTAGCLGNGNVRQWPPLPATRLRVQFGVTAFWGEAIPAIEGAGAFPELWLDTPDPVAWLRALP